MTSRLELPEGTICEWCACGDPAVGFMVGTRLPICEWAAASCIVLRKPPPPPASTTVARTTAPRPPRAGFIYFIQAGTRGPVKIGWTVRNPFGRLAFFQTGHWQTLRLVRQFPGTVPDERALHKRFAEYRIRNEWFWPVVLELFPAEEHRG